MKKIRTILKAFMKSIKKHIDNIDHFKTLEEHIKNAEKDPESNKERLSKLKGLEKQLFEDFSKKKLEEIKFLKIQKDAFDKSTKEIESMIKEKKSILFIYNTLLARITSLKG